MLQTIGVKELSTRTSSIVQQVKEEAAAYVITHHGLPVALLRPISKQNTETLLNQDAAAAWQNLLETGKLLAKSRRNQKSALEILEKTREEEN